MPKPVNTSQTTSWKEYLHRDQPQGPLYMFSFQYQTSQKPVLVLSPSCNIQLHG